MKEKVVSFLSLFGSTATLLCCALPAFIAAIAGGAAVASLVSNLPWLVTVSQYKGRIFLVAALLISLNATLTFYPKGKVACAITGGKGCEVAGAFQKVMFWTSAIIYTIGAFMAYGYIYILQFFES